MLRPVRANLNYSSWSMRPWLALKHAGLEFRVHDVGMKTTEHCKDRIRSFSGAGKVPPHQQIIGIEHDGARAVLPRALEGELEPAIGQALEPILSDRRAGDVTAEPLELAAVSAVQPPAPRGARVSTRCIASLCAMMPEASSAWRSRSTSSTPDPPPDRGEIQPRDPRDRQGPASLGRPTRTPPV